MAGKDPVLRGSRKLWQGARREPEISNKRAMRGTESLKRRT